ncbi:MAG: hypothetical protein EBS75_03475 [Betaproteobacteria bacterium]|nr:hypothetical protein [Betaproteobacteria bacterium]
MGLQISSKPSKTQTQPADMRQKGARLQTYIKRQTDDGIGPCARLRLSRLIIGGAAEPWPFSAAGPPQETKAGTSIARAPARARRRLQSAAGCDQATV